ncbi:MAG TPA: hypothetical protein VG013_30375 [Gemmataceae bacterium]|jgi:hypothetical protein|nr:hypothetical protein [Gemmataceae bacterium]
MFARRCRSLVSLCAVVCLPCAACGPLQLRYESLHQVRTVYDIQQQQVLDNLAMFFYDVNSVPYFAWPSNGTAEVDTNGSASSQTAWQRIVNAGIHGWAMTNLQVTAMDTTRAIWTLNPINDPRKLQLMRCAYQQVVRVCYAECGHGCPHAGAGGGLCPDCAKLFSGFYTGSPDKPVPPPGAVGDTGEITNLCLGTHCRWLGWGRKKDVPKGCGCEMVAHYCGTYVWVLPGGRDELAKLTLAILDYAVNPPATPPGAPTKEVSFYIDKDGRPAARDKAVGTVKATIHLDEPVAKVYAKAQLASLKAELSRPGLAPKRTNDLTLEKQQLEAILSSAPDAAPPVPQRGPSLDELSLGVGAFRSAIYQALPPISPARP